MLKFKVGDAVETVNGFNVQQNTWTHVNWAVVIKVTPKQVHVRNEHRAISKYWNCDTDVTSLRQVGYNWPYSTYRIRKCEPNEVHKRIQTS